MAEVAAAFGVAWHIAHTALVTAAASWLPTPPPTRVLGIDETRSRRVRWLLESAGWRRSDPWLTSFVNADTTSPGVLLGLTPGRSGGCVRTWLAQQPPAFRTGIELVVIDTSAALPHDRIAVGHWHLVRLANEMVTEVGQRVARQRHGRRGTPPTRSERTAGCCSPPAIVSRPASSLGYGGCWPTTTRPTRSAAAWGCTQLLRQLLAETDPDRIPHRLRRFYDACARAEMDETTRLPAPSRPGGQPSQLP